MNPKTNPTMETISEAIPSCRADLAFLAQLQAATTSSKLSINVIGREGKSAMFCSQIINYINAEWGDKRVFEHGYFYTNNHNLLTLNFESYLC